MQVGDVLKEVNGELLDDKTPSEGVCACGCLWVRGCMYMFACVGVVVGVWEL